MSLLRTAARASVATRVIGNTHRRQQQRWAAEDATAASDVLAAPVHVPAELMIQQLTQLGQLRDSGVLTDEEFTTQKQRLLATS